MTARRTAARGPVSHYPAHMPPQPPFEGERPAVGDRVRFDGLHTSWLARAQTRDGRYLLLTAAMFGAVFYTLVDFEQNIRGAMNVIGHGLGIETKDGPDPAIDAAIAQLEDPHGGWEISHRNVVELHIDSTRKVVAS